jgi:hypothetical protein
MQERLCTARLTLITACHHARARLLLCQGHNQSVFVGSSSWQLHTRFCSLQGGTPAEQVLNQLVSSL